MVCTDASGRAYSKLLAVDGEHVYLAETEATIDDVGGADVPWRPSEIHIRLITTLDAVRTVRARLPARSLAARPLNFR